MATPKIPKAWVSAGTKKIEAAATSTEATKVTARIDMSPEVAGAGLCPECRKPMDKAFANGIECYVCHPDRIAIPVPDNVEEGATAPMASAPAQAVEPLPELKFSF